MASEKELIKNMEKTEKIIDKLGEEMLIRMKENYRKQKEKIVMENYKHVELLQNIESDSESEKEKSSTIMKSRIKKEGNENDKTTKTVGKEEEEEDEEDEKNRKKEDEEDEKNRKKEDEEEEDEEEEVQYVKGNIIIEGYGNKDGNGDNGKKKNKKSKNKTNKKNNSGFSGLKSKMGKFKDKFKEFYGHLADDWKKINQTIPRFLCKMLSFDSKVSKDDREFVKNLWKKIVFFLLTCFVFLNWFYFIFFEQISPSSTTVFDYSYTKQFDYMTDNNTILRFFFLFPLKVLELIKYFLISTFFNIPFNWLGFGIELIVPTFFIYFIYQFNNQYFFKLVSNIGKYFTDKNLTGITPLVIISCLLLVWELLYCTYINPLEGLKYPFYGNLLTSGLFMAFIYSIIWLFIKFFICGPITVLFVLFFLIYISLLTLFVSPIVGKGVLGTIREIQEALNNFNPKFSDVTDTEGCVSNLDSCRKHPGLFHYVYWKMLIPTFIFVMRHFFSFFTILFLLYAMITCYVSVDSLALKMNIITISTIIICLTLFTGKWFSQLTISLPMNNENNATKELDLKLLPLLGAVILMFSYLFILCRDFFLKDTTRKIMSIVVMILLILGMIVYSKVVHHNVSVDLKNLPISIGLFAVLVISSYFRPKYMFDSAVGKIILSVVGLFCIFGIVKSLL